MNKTAGKIELSAAAFRGITKYLKSTRGAAMFGANAEVIAVGGSELQVCRKNTVLFTIKITAVQ